MVKVESLVKTYRTRGKVIEAVKGISFEARSGEVFALLGPNGAGKTTTIKCILGLVEPDSGEIFIDGVDALRNRRKAARKLSAVLEGNRNVYWMMTAKENLEYFGGLHGLWGRNLKRRMEEVVSLLGIKDFMNSLAGKLSRGQQQKLAIAVALLPDAPVILLDEPTLGLDVESSIEMRKIVKKLAEMGKTVILSTHDMALVEAVADTVLIINRGKKVVLDSKKNLLQFFKRRAYRITLGGRLDGEVERKLSALGRVKVTSDGETEIVIEVPNHKVIYDVFDVLKEKRLPILSLEPETVNFEQVFVKLIRGEGR